MIIFNIFSFLLSLSSLCFLDIKLDSCRWILFVAVFQTMEWKGDADLDPWVGWGGKDNNPLQVAGWWSSYNNSEYVIRISKYRPHLFFFAQALRLLRSTRSIRLCANDRRYVQLRALQYRRSALYYVCAVLYADFCFFFLFFFGFFLGGLGYTNLILCPAAIGFNVETVTYKNLKFQVWDLGGQTSIRPYWRWAGVWMVTSR